MCGVDSRVEPKLINNIKINLSSEELSDETTKNKCGEMLV